MEGDSSLKKNDLAMVLARYWSQKSPRRHQTTLQHLQQDLIPKLKLLRPRFLKELEVSTFFFFQCVCSLAKWGGERNRTQVVTQVAETTNRGSEATQM